MNEHIIISKLQADSINGKHGKFSEIEPVATPDGSYIIPERCLNDADLATVKATLESMVTVENVKQIEELPLLGQPCLAGRLYLYNSESSPLVKCVKTHNRTEHAVETIPNLFTFFRNEIEGTVLDWIPNELVKPTWKRKYNGKDYIFIGAAETLTVTGQTPDLVPALWQEIIVINPDVKPPQWVSSDYYKYTPVGYEVFDLGKVWKVKTLTHTYIQPALTGNGAISWTFVKDWVD